MYTSPQRKLCKGEELAFVLLISCSGCYATKIALSPIYFIYGFAFMLMTLVWLFRGHASISRKSYMFYILPCAILVFAFIIEVSNIKNCNTTIGFMMSIFVLPITLGVSTGISEKTIEVSSRGLIWISLIFFAIDTYLRFTRPDYGLALIGIDHPDQAFYAYKMNGLMYQDSNFLGLHASVLFGFSCFLSEKYSKNMFLEKLLLTISICGSLSRASMVAGLVIFLFSLRHNKRILALLIVLTFFAFLVYGLAYIESDGSYSSKQDIIKYATQFISERATIGNVLLGVGFGNSVNVLGIGAHNLFVMLIIERGVIGLILVSLFWFAICRQTRWTSLYVFLPFWVNGLSLTAHSVPYLYASAAIIIILTRKQLSRQEFISHRTLHGVNPNQRRLA